MLNVVYSNRFKADFKLAIKRNFDVSLLNEVVDKLARQEPLDPKYCDHKLTGQFKNFRECHIQPNWLLVYRVDNNDLELYLFRTGTHSDIF